MIKSKNSALKGMLFPLNKKGVVTKALIILAALAVIALVFLIFYLWYSSQGKDLEQTLNLESKSMKESQTLLTVLKAPVSADRTIADAIAHGEFQDIQDKVGAVLKGRKYVLYADSRIIATSSENPELLFAFAEPIVQHAALPTPEIKIIDVRLEIE